jgi:hypothetical protein
MTTIIRFVLQYLCSIKRRLSVLIEVFDSFHYLYFNPNEIFIGIKKFI